MKKYFRLVGAVAVICLQSCSMVSTLYLYNALADTITVKISYRRGPTSTVEILPSSIGRFGLNTEIRKFVTIEYLREDYCYVVTPIPVAWIKSGFWGRKVFFALDQEKELVLYPPSAKKRTYYIDPPPEQPDGFPLTPSKCAEKSRNG